MQEIDEKKRPESLFFENYRFIIPIWGIPIFGICDWTILIRPFLLPTSLLAARNQAKVENHTS